MFCTNFLSILNPGFGTPKSASRNWVTPNRECISKLKLKHQKKILLLLAIYSPISGEKCRYEHRIDPTGHGENLCIKSTEGTETKKRTDKTTPSKNYLLLIAFALQSTTTLARRLGSEIRNGWTWPILCDDDDHDAIGNGEKGIPLFFSRSFADKNNSERTKKKDERDLKSLLCEFWNEKRLLIFISVRDF